ncbi:MAG: tRNA pseudouridine(38-40) synthase TruA [Leptolyngbyaceae cyanobacterium bins.59]|nr:tRNA pseudouridine(38-40) synthase TruA [Leptolyngbyaceae cyanobacterium bins.59]
MSSSTSLTTQRVALVIQYLGTRFHGWQRQPNRRTVQEEIEVALKGVVGKPVTLHGAGRTDSGVHAAAQVAHFDDPTSIPPHRWMAILNSRLPDDILIRASAPVAPRWHARFSAIWRRYRYTIYTDRTPNLFVRSSVWHYYRMPLDESLMQAALLPMLGRHHMAAFHRANSSRTHSWIEIQDVMCVRETSFIHIEVQANSFLYGMMRLLVGFLVQVGQGSRSLTNFTEIWKMECREEVKYAAPPQGLCLLRVGYPDFPFPPQVWFETQPKPCLPAMSV